MVQRIANGVRSVVWFVAVAVAAAMASERVYWYWAGIDPDSVSVLGAFYAVATAVALATLARVPGSRWRIVVLGGAIYALVVEGIVTPVVYEDGPLPLLFAMFVGWHGVLAFAGFVVLVRRWAIDRRTRALALTSACTGVGWGGWALASAVTDRETAAAAALDGGSATVLEPIAFAVYATWVGAVVIGSHLVIDRSWPSPGWRPSRTGLGAISMIAMGLAALMVMPAVPWAPVKFLAIAWVLWRLLDRQAEPGSPTVIDSLAGRIRITDLLPLAVLPIAASATYAVLWPVRAHPSMAVVWAGAIGLQVGCGLLALALAARRSPPAALRSGADASVVEVTAADTGTRRPDSARHRSAAPLPPPPA